MDDKVTLLCRLSKPDLEAKGLFFLPEKLYYCDVPVLRIKSCENIVVFREGNWSNFPFKELQQSLGKGCEVVSVNYIDAFNTTIIVFKNSPFDYYEKELITNGTGEEFSISICECEHLRPPFNPIWNFVM